MIRSLALFILLSVSTSLYAETVKITSGEHENFTRIVFKPPSISDWSIRKSGRNFILDVPGATSFNTSDLFSLIPRTRLLSTSVQDDISKLLLIMNCDCEIQASTNLNDWAILDIYNKSHQGYQPVALEVPKFENSPNIQISGIDLLTSARVRDSANILSKIPLKDSPPPSRSLNVSADQVIEQAISDNVQRALSVGLIEGRVPHEIQPEESTPIIEITPPSGQVSIKPSPGVEIRNSIDRPLNSTQEIQINALGNQNCIPDTSLEIYKWATDDPIYAQLASIRSKMFGEFDRVDSNQVVALSKVYIHFGFGREAVASFALDDIRSSERTTIEALADIIEGNSQNHFTNQIGCAGLSEMWAILAQEIFDPEVAGLDPQRLVRSFRTLPASLANTLAPRFSESLLRLGFPDVARTVLSPLQQDVDPTVEKVLAQVQIDVVEGKTLVAQEELESIAISNPSVDPNILISLTDLILSSSGATPVWLDSLLMDKVFEVKDPVLVSDLVASRIKLFIKAGSLGEAAKVLSEQEVILSSEYEDLVDDLYEAALGKEGNYSVLNLLFETDLKPTSEDLRSEVDNVLTEEALYLNLTTSAFSTKQSQDFDVSEADMTDMLANAEETELEVDRFISAPTKTLTPEGVSGSVNEPFEAQQNLGVLERSDLLLLETDELREGWILELDKPINNISK